MPAARDFWDQPYYKLAKTVTIAVGQWPYQSIGARLAHIFVIHSLTIAENIAQVFAAWVHRDDFEIVLDCFAPFLVDVGMWMKTINNWCHLKRMHHLLEQIKYNWDLFPENNALHLLHEHSAFGQKFARIYMTGIWLSVASYVTEPLQQRFMAHLAYPNITLPRRLSAPMEFGPIDLETWYYSLWFATSLAILARLTVVGACDLVLFTVSEHANGLLKALGYTIEHLPPYNEADKDDETFLYMKRCAMIHSRAIEFSEHIRDTYLWTFSGIIGLNMILMSVTGLQIVNNLDNTERLVKFVVNLITQMVHFFVECFVAQRMMDASLDFKETLTNAKYYDASIKTQKLIPLMLMRAQNPVVLTAGKVIIMNMDTYATVLRTAGSYFTILLAMQ